MEKQRLLEQLEAYSNMGEGDNITITADLLDTLQQAKEFIQNGYKNCEEYWKRVVIDYIDCMGENEELHNKLDAMSESDRKLFFEKVINGLLNDNDVWSSIDRNVDYYVNRAINEYEEESGE